MPDHLTYLMPLTKLLNQWRQDDSTGPIRDHCTDPFKIQKKTTHPLEPYIDKIEFGSSYAAFHKLTRGHWLPAAQPCSSSHDTDFGFIILRHVNSAETNKYWQTCYTQVRKFHAEPIIIIDDNSDAAFLTDLETHNCQVVQSEFPARGELLPYYYFHKLRPWNKAIFIHDSLFLRSQLDVGTVQGIKPLWYFPKNESPPSELPSVLMHLKAGPALVVRCYSQSNQWIGIFGGMAVMEWSFIDLLASKYNLFVLLDYIKSRALRMCFERIIGLLSCEEKPFLIRELSVFGPLSNLTNGPGNYTYNDWLVEKRNRPAEKVFTGR